MLRTLVTIVAENVRGDGLDTLAKVLRAAALPCGDLALPGRTFLRFHDEFGPVGWGGYELHADAALLRSVVILPERRGRGLGRVLVGELLQRAAGVGARTAYLLTETATAFFEALGFAVLDRALAPSHILETKQAKELCPISACLMRKEIAMTVTIYHNPDCSTSRNVLALIRNSGEEPRVVEYLKTPPSRAELVGLIGRMAISVRDLLRRKGAPYDELGLDSPALTDDDLLDAMMAHPILINRPIVVSDKGVKLCRPSEAVLDILSHPQRGAFSKEDGEAVVDAAGARIARPAP